MLSLGHGPRWSRSVGCSITLLGNSASSPSADTHTYVRSVGALIQHLSVATSIATAAGTDLLCKLHPLLDSLIASRNIIHVYSVHSLAYIIPTSEVERKKSCVARR